MFVLMCDIPVQVQYRQPFVCRAAVTAPNMHSLGQLENADKTDCKSVEGGDNEGKGRGSKLEK